MSQPVIKVENLGKKYTIGYQKQEKYTALRDVISNTVKSVLKPDNFSNYTKKDFWALQDINFEINQGDRIGLIGRNGAGKSTLLKVLSRITEPTKGQIKIRGRVASLLEVGTGFHPELTGRENIFLNGAILGMSKKEIKQKFDEIVAFAEVEKFLDTPVKRYSSGMYVRLAFAVAAHLEPEILIVDEVLAVGDAKFQKKCLGKMEQVGKEGRTVLFVSHNMAAINRLCQKVIWLKNGQISMQGDTENIVSDYMTDDSTMSGECIWKEGISNPGVNEFKLMAVRIKNDHQQIAATLDARKSFRIEIEYEILEKLPYCRVGIIITTVEGVVVFAAYDSDNEDFAGARQPGLFVSHCEIPGYLLNTSRFLVSINAGLMGQKNFIKLENILSFELENTRQYNSQVGFRRGVIHPNLAWNRKLVEAPY